VRAFFIGEMILVALRAFFIGEMFLIALRAFIIGVYFKAQPKGYSVITKFI
jgi:hypothetical protein